MKKDFITKFRLKLLFLVFRLFNKILKKNFITYPIELPYRYIII